MGLNYATILQANVRDVIKMVEKDGRFEMKYLVIIDVLLEVFWCIMNLRRLSKGTVIGL